ncbi:hypothetical protein BHM03_00055794, partial [Ensete ventricosum]
IDLRISQKDALALPSPSLRRDRRRYPCASDGCLARRQSPCQGVTTPAARFAPTGAAPLRTGDVALTSGRRQPLRATLLPAGSAPTGNRRQATGVCRPLRAGLGRSRLPFATDLAVVGQHCMGAGRG